MPDPQRAPNEPRRPRGLRPLVQGLRPRPQPAPGPGGTDPPGADRRRGRHRGAGPGLRHRPAFSLAGRAGASVTAVNFSGGMLAEARRKPGADAVRFLVHDLHEPLPFAPASFDRVVSGLVLEHLDDLDGFFREARRVLRAEGLAFISAMHPAMFLRDSQAQFTDPESGERVRPGSRPHSSATS